MYTCDSISPEKREEHIKLHKKNTMPTASAAKSTAPKAGTQHTAVEANDEDKDSVTTIELNANGMPTCEFFLKEYGFTGVC